jgi:hypothetical protein
MYAVDRVKQALMLETDRPFVLREAIRPAATLQHRRRRCIRGIRRHDSCGLYDEPIIEDQDKGRPVQHYMQPLLKEGAERRHHPSFVIAHRVRLEDAPRCITPSEQGRQLHQVVLKPRVH